MKNLKLLLSSIILIVSYSLSAQMAVTTDGSSADGSAMLEVKSTNKGFLPPRMTVVQRDAISSPATGLLIYQTDGTTGFWCYNGSNWVQLTPIATETDPSVPIGTAAGQMQYWDGSAWVTVAAGTTGQLLSVNASGIPEWQNPSSLKSAATQAPTMTATGVTFNGVVNANGLSTTVAFEYGTSISYGTTVTATQSPVTGTTNIAVTSGEIASFTIGTTYHVRLITQNVFGTFYGDDITFTYLYYGASYAGGLVFSIDNSGQHGLVCAATDQSVSCRWFWAFEYYTATINGFDDWYLPPLSTLNLMYTNLKLQGLGGFADDYYWSSTEENLNFAWMEHFGYQWQEYDWKDSESSLHRVRAVRAF